MTSYYESQFLTNNIYLSALFYVYMYFFKPSGIGKIVVWYEEQDSF